MKDQSVSRLASIIVPVHFPGMSRFRLGIARSLTLVGAILFWTWTSAKAAVTLIGASTVGDDFQQLVDRLPLWANWLFSTPWWVPSLLAAALTVFLVWLSWPSQALGPAAASPKAPNDQALPNEIKSAVRQPFLEAALIVCGSGTAKDMQYPEYRARFARNGRAATFFVEFSIHFPSVGSESGWSKPKKIELLYRDRFASGQDIAFPLVSPCMTDHGTRWQFGLPSEADGVAKPHIGQGLNYRGRVTMLSDEGSEQHCYFILSTNENANEIPKVTGEHMFAHLSEWEGREPPGGNAQILFSQA